jgi:hypothetical protein
VFLAPQSENLSYRDFKTLLKAGKVIDLLLWERTITGRLLTNGLEGLLPPAKIKELRTSGNGEPRFVTVQVDDPILAEMDGFDTQKGIILLAATNRPEILDPALLRPGRFDRQVVIDRPDLKGRAKILRVHTRQVTLAPAVNLEQIAARTPGFVGADLANLVNEAALRAAREGLPWVRVRICCNIFHMARSVSGDTFPQASGKVPRLCR